MQYSDDVDRRGLALTMRIAQIGIGLLTFLIALAFALTPTQLVAQCRPGDTLIGESPKYYFCSHRSCPELEAQIALDQDALRRLQRSMDLSNRELDEWAKQNDDAQKAALHRAKMFLATTILGGITANREAKLDAITKDLQRADAPGTTYSTKLLKVATFRKSYARLVSLIALLKAAEYPGADAYETWASFKAHAKTVGHEADELASAWRDLATDPELQTEFREQGFEFSANSLKVALNKYPLLTQSLDLGGFLVGYGYDASQWEASRRLIEQNTHLSDKNLFAECVLSRQLKITVRNAAICRGQIPSDTAPRPEEIQCVDHSVP